MPHEIVPKFVKGGLDIESSVKERSEPKDMYISYLEDKTV